MNYFLDLMYQLLVHPRLALRAITRGEQLRHAGFLWLFVVVVTSLSSVVEGPGFLTVFFFCLIGMGLSVFLHSAVTDYCAGMLGGRGTAKGITAGFMAASFPYAFSVFGTLLSALSGGASEGLLGGVVFLWSFVLDVAAISENYRLSTMRAVFVACIPGILLAALAVCLLFLGVAAAVAGITQMQDLGAVEQALQSL